MLDYECGWDANLRLVRRQIVAGISAIKLKGKYWDDNKKLYFVDKFSNSAGQKE
jgi:hypothetical protein